MAKLSKTDVHKGNVMPPSFFSLENSRFISKPLVPLLAAVGVRNPNMGTLSSFVVLAVEASFALDCADWQLARMLKKSSVFGAWLGKYLDRGDGSLHRYMFTLYTTLYTMKESIISLSVLNMFAASISCLKSKFG